MSDSDADEYVYYGKPLVDESKVSFYASGKPEKGAIKSVPVHKQEVRDEEGRKRLHGAFTGGFSAGFYNTVGSEASCRHAPTLHFDL